MNQILTTDGTIVTGTTGIPLQATPIQNIPWATGTTGTGITWSSTQPTGITEEQLITLLKERLKLKVEEFETNIMISILLDDVEISTDYFMRPAK